MCMANGAGRTGMSGTAVSGGVWVGAHRSTRLGQRSARAAITSEASLAVTPPLLIKAMPLRSGRNSASVGPRATRDARSPSPGIGGPPGSRSTTSAVPAWSAHPNGTTRLNTRSTGDHTATTAMERTSASSEGKHPHRIASHPVDSRPLTAENRWLMAGNGTPVSSG
jgi:hypothetical protein